jgi:hypothetical protein
MNNELDNRIGQTLNSLDGIKRAEASPFLYSKTRNRMEQELELPAPRIAWRVVLAFSLILLLNLLTVAHFRSESKQGSGGAELVANEYSISLPTTY